MGRQVIAVDCAPALDCLPPPSTSPSPQAQRQATCRGYAGASDRLIPSYSGPHTSPAPGRSAGPDREAPQEQARRVAVIGRGRWLFRSSLTLIPSLEALRAPSTRTAAIVAVSDARTKHWHCAPPARLPQGPVASPLPPPAFSSPTYSSPVSLSLTSLLLRHGPTVAASPPPPSCALSPASTLAYALWTCLRSAPTRSA